MAQTLEEINQRIAEIEGQLAGGDIPATRPSESQLQVRKYRAAANAIAEYDPNMAAQWNRQADQVLAAEAKQEDPNKRNIRGLEQLWKDTTRARTQAVRDGDRASVDRYDRQLARLQGQLAELRPEIWADEKTPQQAEGVTEETTVTADPVGNVEIKEQIKGMAVDTAPRDGIIDNISGLKDTINVWREKNNISTQDPVYTSVVDYANNLEDEIKRTFDAEQAAEGIKYSRGQTAKKDAEALRRDKIAQDEKFLPRWSAYNELMSNPGDVTNKRAAINVQLRDESGAAIAQSEFNNMMAFVLDKEDYNRFIDETTGLKTVLLGAVSEDAKVAELTKIAERYLDRVNPNKLGNYINRSISPEYFRKAAANKKPKGEKGTKSNKGPAPKRADYKTFSEYVRARKAWRAK